MDQQPTITETLATEIHKGHEIVVTKTTRSYGDGESYSITEARSAIAGRTRLGSGWDLAKLVKQAAKAIDNQLAIDAILPAATAATLDFGRDFDPRVEHQAFCAVDFDTVQVGDLVWVYSYQVWRRGVVEAIGRTNLKVAVVVTSTRNFSRQSVKPGEVFWDILNKR